MDADEYFSSHERIITTTGELENRINQVDDLANVTGLRFYWRGQSNSTWGVHSSLHRAISTKLSIPVHEVTEALVIEWERRIVSSAREWIRPAVGARLTTVDLLARLQHFAIPTRLLDFSRNPSVALYFAVSTDDTSDARLIVAAARGEIDEPTKDSLDVPWAVPATRPGRWSEQMFALDENEDFPRIVRQEGVFLIGGTPSTRPHRRTGDGTSLLATDVRRCMSLPLALHSWAQAEAASRGTNAPGPRPTFASALTLRIPAAAKASIRADLELQLATDARLFPDPEGYLRLAPTMRELLRS